MAEMNPIPFAKALGKPSQAAIDSAVSDWLDDHPEATTTVEDGSITKAKLDSNLQGTVDDVADLKSAIKEIQAQDQTTGVVGLYSIADGANIADVFSASQAYTTGKIVVNPDDALTYRFVVDHPAGVWNSSHVERVKIGNEITNTVCSINVLEPSATSSDVGKFLKAKTVSGGKVTEYEFGEGGSGSSDKIGNIYNRSYNVSGTKTATLTLSGSTESDHIIYARVEIKSEYEIANVNVKSSPAKTSINIQTITTNEWNPLSYSCVGNDVKFNVLFSDSESHPYEVRNAISFDQTLEFGAGNELSASVIDQMINDDCFGQQYFSVQSDYVIGAVPKKILGVVPKSNGNGKVSTYVECSELGNVQMSSSPNSGWSGWSEIGTYGQPNIASIPIYNQVHGTLETDGMFSVLPLWGAWCVNTGGNTHHGGHLFHGWTTDRQHRLTMVQNIYSDYEAAIFNYTPGGKSEGGGAVRNEGKFNRLRIGADSSKGILIDPIYEIVDGDWVYRYTRAYFQCTPNFSINRIPTYSNSEGVKGDVCFDSNYFYACINTNSWKRFALSDFVGLTSINANYDSGGATIYEDTSLNDLKQYLTVTATLSDSSTLTVSSSDYTLSGTLTAGTSTITVSYEGKTTTFNVTVTAITVVSISAAYNPGSAVIYEDTPLNDLKQYLTVTATLSDSSTLTVSSDVYTLSGTLTVGTSVITVSYSGQTTTFNVTVVGQITSTSISANYNTSGIKIYEIDGVNMLKNNLTVTANYSDSTSETLDSEDYTLAGTLETGTTGNNVITASYSDKSTTFNVAKSSVGQMILDPVTLPSGYTQLTYIESADNADGGSRITTNAKMSTIARAEYGIVLLVTLERNTSALTLGNSRTHFPSLKSSYYGTKKIGGDYYAGDSIDIEYAWMTDKGYILGGYPDVKVDGVTITTATAGSGGTGADDWLRLNAGGNSSTHSRKQRYYFMRMYDSEDNLVHNYVPCKDGSDVVGMYDTVAGTFLSSDSQPFIAGDAFV